MTRAACHFPPPPLHVNETRRNVVGRVERAVMAGTVWDGRSILTWTFETCKMT